jgi:hypothetical protein
MSFSEELCPDPIWRVRGDERPCTFPVRGYGYRHLCGELTRAEVCRDHNRWERRCPSHYGREIVDGVVMHRPWVKRRPGDL